MLEPRRTTESDGFAFWAATIFTVDTVSGIMMEVQILIAVYNFVSLPVLIYIVGFTNFRQRIRYSPNVGTLLPKRIMIWSAERADL